MKKTFYEFTYIISAVLDEEQFKAEVEKVNAFLTENGASIVEVDEWGIRRLEYPIAKQNNGFYVNMYFESEGSVIVKLERLMQINDNIIRYMTLKYDAKMLRQREAVKNGTAPSIFEVQNTEEEDSAE